MFFQTNFVYLLGNSKLKYKFRDCKYMVKVRYVISKFPFDVIGLPPPGYILTLTFCQDLPQRRI